MIESYEKLLRSSLYTGDKDDIRNTFSLIYQDFSKLVAFCISKYVDDIETRKELVNEVFVRFFNNAQNATTSVKYYLLTIAKNLAIDYLKDKNKYVELDNDIPYVDRYESSIAYKDLLNSLRRVLSEKEVEIIVMRAVDGYSFKEIGQKYGMLEKTASTVYNRAIKKYRKKEVIRR